MWDARKTGKSSYLKAHFPNAIYYDLLKSDLYLYLSKSPYLFREEILALPSTAFNNPIIIDEVQKIPILLDEVHWLIENTQASFILCGWSVRKLKQSSVNLLGGGSLAYPLVYPEINDFDLLRVFNHGSIPSHHTMDYPRRSLKAYVEDYLTQEIQAEGLIRNLPAFARFLDCVGFSNGEMLNYSNVARDCGVDAKTVKEYFQICVDTMLGYYLYPYSKKIKRDIISVRPKFYLFDVGVSNYLAKRSVEFLKDVIAGRSCEHFIFLELIAYRGLTDKNFDIHYWRTKQGLEVDFILNNGTVAIEVKISNRIRKTDLQGLIVFGSEHKHQALYLVCLEPRARKTVINAIVIDILPYEDFLKKLWSGLILI